MLIFQGVDKGSPFIWNDMKLPLPNHLPGQMRHLGSSPGSARRTCVTMQFFERDLFGEMLL